MTINYVTFVNALITFVIATFVLFMVIKGMNNAKKAPEEEQAAAPSPRPSAEVELLTEIRDWLAK